MYELHVGTFSSEGTLQAIIPRLDELKDVGINTIEIMPVVCIDNNSIGCGKPGEIYSHLYEKFIASIPKSPFS